MYTVITLELVRLKQKQFRFRLGTLIQDYGYQAVVRHAGWTQDLYNTILARMMLDGLKSQNKETR